jgi:hypothetical protein
MLMQDLQAFSDRINADARVRSLAANWVLDVYIESSDTEERYRLHLDKGRVTGIEPVGQPADDVLLLRAPGPVLHSVFAGQAHPLDAYNAGDLQLYGPQSDQTRLDAISLLVWGA